MNLVIKPETNLSAKHKTVFLW